jgi:hypothetical protein
MGEMKNAFRIVVRKHEGKRSIGKDERIMLEWILEKEVWRVWTEFRYMDQGRD